MLKSLDVSTYSNGYNVDHINCSDLSIAGAAGFYNHDNYYHYAFYYTFFNNWEYVPTEPLFQLRNVILERLGLEIKRKTVTNASQLIAFIKRKIDGKTPVLMIGKYRHLFYANQYLNENDNGEHMIIVSDYDTEKPILAIREFVHLRQAVSSLIRGDLFSRLQLSQKMFIEIWERSNRDFKKERSPYYNTVFSLEPTGESKVNSYFDLIQDIVEKYGFENSKLSNIIQKIGQGTIQGGKIENYSKALTRTFNAPMVIIFDVLEKTLEALATDKTEKDQFRTFKFKYLEFRKNIIAKLMTVLVRGKGIPVAEQEKMFQQIRAIDAELSQWLKSLHQKIQEAKTAAREVKNGLINYALEAVGSADGALQPPSGALKATGDFWVSKAQSTTHWLQANLGQPRVIKKLLVKHAGEFELNTRDYKIQGSTNGNEWFDLVVVRIQGCAI